MLLIQSIIVYGLMIWVMTYFGNIAYKCQYPQGFGGIDIFAKKKVSFMSLLTKSYFIIPILIFCFFSAVRYQVGVDCESYKKTFYSILQFGVGQRESTEIGFINLSKATILFTSSHYLLFFILAFIQISLLYYAQRKTTYTLKYFGLVLILSSMYLSLMNGMRQYIAACTFVALLPFVLEKKKWGWFILGTYLATLMHKSALLLIPFGVIAYLLQYRIPNRYIQIGIAIICLILMDKIDISVITNLYSQVGVEAGYSERDIEIYSNLELCTKSFGIRPLLLLSVYIITMWYSDKMKILFNSKIFNMQYNLFFIATCLYLLFYNNFTIGRLSYYFQIFTPMILSSCLFYLNNSKIKIDKTAYRSIILLLILFFTYHLYSELQAYPLEYSLYKFDLFRN